MKHLLLKITAVISTFVIGAGVVSLSAFRSHPSPQIKLQPFPDVYLFYPSARGKGVYDSEHVSPMSGNRTAFSKCEPDSTALLKAPPYYPQIVKDEHLSGTVNVKIMVDETGKVIRAIALCGHSFLQQAAVPAAYQEHFSPLIVDGQAVKAVGVITYDYELAN